MTRTKESFFIISWATHLSDYETPTQTYRKNKTRYLHEVARIYNKGIAFRLLVPLCQENDQQLDSL